jgi:hypothetical protein
MGKLGRWGLLQTMGMCDHGPTLDDRDYRFKYRNLNLRVDDFCLEAFVSVQSCAVQNLALWIVAGHLV